MALKVMLYDFPLNLTKMELQKTKKYQSIFPPKLALYEYFVNSKNICKYFATKIKKKIELH